MSLIINMSPETLPSTNSLSLKSRNPWGQLGSEIELQRADLWFVDLSSACSGLQRAGANFSFPTGTIGALAHQVTLPGKKIEAKPFRRHNVPVMMPDFDAALDSFRIGFYLDNQTTQSWSLIYTLLAAWQQLARVGRDNWTSKGINARDGSTTSFIPDFRFDIFVYLLRGLTARELEAYAESGAEHLRVAQGYHITNAWVSLVKIDDLDQKSGNRLMTVSADFYAEDIQPV